VVKVVATVAHLCSEFSVGILVNMFVGLKVEVFAYEEARGVIRLL
jgi:hypothetical protein